MCITYDTEELCRPIC